jgi:predicted GNAT family acetyltransferase
MEIKHEDNGTKGSFFIELENVRVGEMNYVWVGTEKIIIDHTDVGEALKGKGAGKLMLNSVVDFARKKGIKIVPLCPFAKSVFEKTPELNDVL